MLDRRKLQMMPLLVSHFLLRVECSNAEFFERRLFGLKLESAGEGEGDNFFFATSQLKKISDTVTEYKFDTNVETIMKIANGFNYSLDVLSIDLKPTSITLIMDNHSGLDPTQVSGTFSFFNGRRIASLPVNEITEGDFKPLH